MFKLDAIEREKYVAFLKTVPQSAQKLTAGKVPGWGKMTAQHMVEHMQVTVTASTIVSLKTPQPGKLQLEAKNFLIYSPDPMPRNLDNPMFRFGLPVYTNPTIEVAKEKMAKSLDMFFKTFDNKPNAVSYNPFLGDLTYEELLVFHYKHFKHHLEQFELI